MIPTDSMVVTAIVRTIIRIQSENVRNRFPYIPGIRSIKAVFAENQITGKQSKDRLAGRNCHSTR